MDDTDTGTGGIQGTRGPSNSAVALASRLHLPLGHLLGASLDDKLIALEALTKSITCADPIDEADRYGATFLGQAALRAHLISESLTGAQLDWMGLEEEAGTWDPSRGFRTYPHFVAKTFGISGANARRLVTLAKGLRNSLPATRRRLRAGQIGVDQAQILLKAIATEATAESLQLPSSPAEATSTGCASSADTTGTAPATTDTEPGTGAKDTTEPGAGPDGTDDVAEPDDAPVADAADGDISGADPADDRRRADGTTERRAPTVEELLLDHAAMRSPEDLRKLVDHYVAVADPDATDKAHRQAADREYLSVDRTLGGYNVAGFLTIEHGQYIRTALESVMGPPAAGETRTAAQRRAQALADLAHTALDQGKVGTSASVRPHVGVLISTPEFLDLVRSTEAAEAAGGVGRGPAAGPETIADPLPGLAPTADPIIDNPPPGAAQTGATPAVPGPAVPGPAVPGPVVPGLAVPGPAVPGPVVPGLAVPGPAVPGPAVPGLAVPGPAVPGPVVPGPLTADSGAAADPEPGPDAPASSPEQHTGVGSDEPASHEPPNATGGPAAPSGEPSPCDGTAPPTRRTGVTGSPSRPTGTAVPATSTTDASTATPTMPTTDATGANSATSPCRPPSDATGTALPTTPTTDASTATPPIDATGTATPPTTDATLPLGSVAQTRGSAISSTGRDWAALLASGPATFIDNTGPVPRDLLERMINCHGEIYRIIFGPDNEVLNHGRAHRLFTAHQRRALVARDRHCVHLDCTAPPERCESHHGARAFADGGNTDLHDGCLLCYHHHAWVHAHNITMRRINGTWHFYKPDGTEIRPTKPPWN
ncbi:HNH endonuclease [Occultella glacieicola]|uniref:HNH endonuclease n=1 Tax=Occultella glacieicola TaxID=2518684 RepID=A0ABY2E0X8_9MICO|nr:HNH endonuclease signature motif containing protein [Occultella glacieicola]TDE89625.1 HNH endonuclease [Occultella glacieicola]